MSTLKNALKSLEYVPGRANINEQPVDAENEDEENINAEDAH